MHYEKTEVNKKFEPITGIDPQAIINYAFAHGCLGACWSKEDEGHYPKDTTTAALLEGLTNLDNVR